MVKHRREDPGIGPGGHPEIYGPGQAYMQHMAHIQCHHRQHTIPRHTLCILSRHPSLDQLCHRCRQCRTTTMQQSTDQRRTLSKA